jgi:hypothetical protein
MPMSSCMNEYMQVCAATQTALPVNLTDGHSLLRAGMVLRADTGATKQYLLTRGYN